jgi:hypothetical protein
MAGGSRFSGNSGQQAVQFSISLREKEGESVTDIQTLGS